MILCDTNIFIEIFRNNSVIQSVLEYIGYENIVISDVSRAELFYGARNKTELQAICNDLNKLPALPIQPDISRLAVDLVERYCLSHKLDIEDALIAATAIHNNIELYTLNLKDFIFLPDIRIYQSSIWMKK
jgi:predicted nucleic acid-binding protein